MACPDTDDGFVMIALELGAALALARLTVAEQLIVWEVIAQTYGPTKATHAALSASDLSKRTGLDRAFIAKGIASLAGSNMLTKGRDGYKLQKNYDRWDRTGHKETEEQAQARRAYAKGAPKAARTRRSDASSDCVNIDTPPCVNIDTPPVSIQTQPCVNIDTPILYRELRVLEKQQQHAGETSESKTTEPRATIPIKPAEQPPAEAPPAEPTLADSVARIEALIVELGVDMADFRGGKIPAMIRQFSVEWVEMALIDAVQKSASDIGPRPLMLKMLRDWKRLDGPQNDPKYTGEIRGGATRDIGKAAEYTEAGLAHFGKRRYIS